MFNENPESGVKERFVHVTADGLALEGDLVLPKDAQGIIVFAHGSGSSRHSPRNQYVARMLAEAGFATLLFDLLTTEEEREDMWKGHLRFDVSMLSRRLISATEWVMKNADTRGFPIGYFGASTGAAAALIAASKRPDIVKAVVSRGGRPDLAGAALSRVKAPTLLIVGGNDYSIIGINQDALNQLNVEKRLAVIPGATHLFEEPGALEEVSRLAAEWFLDHIRLGEAKKPKARA